MLDRTPVVFISYSWSSDEYQEKVIDLATKLRHDGVDVRLDVWDLKDGHDKYVYMEQCVTDPTIDKVLILCDKKYSEKADNRQGGVGDETTIITSEVYGKAQQEKFIPVIMERDENGKEFLPAYLKSRMYKDLSGNNYNDNYRALLRVIYNQPEKRKPSLGTAPSWLTEDEPEELVPIKDAARRISAAELGKLRNIALYDFIDAYIVAMKQFYKPDGPKPKEYLEDFQKMQEYRDVFLEQMNVFSGQNGFGGLIADSFERLYNTLFDIKTFDPERQSFNKYTLDIFRVHIWELFICVTAYMLRYELYVDIHDMLEHTYYLRSACYDDKLMPASYEGFRIHSEYLEEIVKKSLEDERKNKITLMGHLLCIERTNPPIYTTSSLAESDLFLFQVYKAFNLEELSWHGFGWFPTCYIYANRYSSPMWVRLKSKRFCEKIMSLFGVMSIDKLKEAIAKCTLDKDYHYRDSFDYPIAIMNCVKIEEIATLP